MTTTSQRIETLSRAEARRVALAAQGFAGAKRIRKRRPFDPALERLGVLQLDSVNVFARSHYMPVLSRHGAYDRDSLDRELWGSGRYTEYWAHEAALLPVADRPLFRWRMREYFERYRRDDRFRHLGPELDRVRAILADRGPSFVRELESTPRQSRGPWWDWSDTKRAVEMLFSWGEVVAATRVGFQRQYALAADALPEFALVEPADDADSRRELLRRAARSLGVATVDDLADYHRQKIGVVRPLIRQLEDAGELVPVAVAGWKNARGEPLPAWMHRDARLPGRLAPNALLTPFDPLVWYRPRAERLFDFHYRIEIYTPEAKRAFGYYCLPLMVGGRMAGRIDLKADRAAGVLLVQAAWQEPGAPVQTPEVAGELLRQAAEWQGLSDVVDVGRGNLRPVL